MKKTKYLGIMVLALLLCTVLGGCQMSAEIGGFDKNDPDTWYASASNGGVDDALVKQIETGMTFSEIVEVLGKPQRDIGSGVWVMEWEMKSGSVLAVSFNSTTDKTGAEQAASDRELNLVSFYMEVKAP